MRFGDMVERVTGATAPVSAIAPAPAPAPPPSAPVLSWWTATGDDAVLGAVVAGPALDRLGAPRNRTITTWVPNNSGSAEGGGNFDAVTTLHPDFQQWLASRGYTLRVAHVSSGNRGTNYGGIFDGSGRLLDMSGQDYSDALTFMDQVTLGVLAFIGGAAVAQATGGAAVAAGGSTESEAIVSAAQTDVLPSASQLSSVGPYDSFAYSSGEGTTALTDAANVDFGWGVQPDAGAIPDTQLYPASQDYVGSEVSNVVKGGTPESLVSDYGTTYPSSEFDPEVSGIYSEATKQSAVDVAVRAGAATPSTTGVLSGGGALSPILKAIFGTPPQAKPPIQSNVGTQSTRQQNELAQPITYEGQLGSGNALSGMGSVSPMVWVAIGFGLVLVAYSFKR
jgi:hypothetical protein